jgi:hypothetical protein
MYVVFTLINHLNIMADIIVLKDNLMIAYVDKLNYCIDKAHCYDPSSNMHFAWNAIAYALTREWSNTKQEAGHYLKKACASVSSFGLNATAEDFYYW